MKKRSKIRDYDFEGVDILRDNPENEKPKSENPEGESLENEEKPQSMAAGLESDLVENIEENANKETMPEEMSQFEKDEKSDQPETKEREEMIERIFSSYPETAELLAKTKALPIDATTEKFMALVEGFARGRGLEWDELDRTLRLLFGIGAGCLSGNLTLEMIETLMKGADYDRVLNEEIRAAELRGRNANIEAQMRQHKTGDGVPHLESRGASTAKRNRGIFSLAEDARK